jgi:uncharacterized membrane protein required for colicin V production
MLYGINWVDIVIVLIIVLAVAKGIKVGILAQLFAIIGFFGALFLAGWLIPHILPIHDLTIKTLVNTIIVLAIASIVGIIASGYGQSIHWSFRLGKLIGSPKLETAENVLGCLPAIVATLIFVWLIGVAIGRMPFVGLSNSVDDSFIVQHLTYSLPTVPSVFAEFTSYINPNSPPYVFNRPKPNSAFNYSSTNYQNAELKAVKSIVRISSFSCGGITAGSGFIVGNGLVATDAHVIAGSKRPIIKYNNHSYEGVPLYFNPDLDLAIMRVKNLDAPKLSIYGNAPLDSTVAILGYPGGNFRSTPGILRETLAVNARSIYDQGIFGRGVYVVQTSLETGSSGSPIVLENGQVAGIIFSISTSNNNYAYALTSSLLSSPVQKSETSSTRVGTGACID